LPENLYHFTIERWGSSIEWYQKIIKFALIVKDGPLCEKNFFCQIGRAVGGFDMNVREAWLMGYAGRNVSISILDDGIQRDHPDLVHNYDPYASTDINDHDADPTPQNNGDNKYVFLF